MRRSWLIMLLVGCAEVEESEAPTETQAEVTTEDVEEKSRRCRSARIQCEQMCFYEYGQTWGTWSLTYNACMDECLEQYERCTHRPHRIAPREGR